MTAVSRATVAAALDRVATWLDTMQAPGQPNGVSRFSARHDTDAWAGVLLPATYNSVLCRTLLTPPDQALAIDRAAVTQFLTGFARADGTFGIAEMRDADVFKTSDRTESWRYIHFHITNYAIGALDALGAPPPALDFARPYLDPANLEQWLAQRDLTEPWMEGNNLVNLASFLLALSGNGPVDQRTKATAALDLVLAWHNAAQDPATGFWWDPNNHEPDAKLHAMAGATHNFHIYYALDRPVPHSAAIIDYCLSLSPAASTACLDVDPVDILCAFHNRVDHRRDEIHHWLTAKLTALLAIQNPDGGFADAAAGILRLDGWTGGYAEDQGNSNTFATWFRVIAIAMIARTLWPTWRQWTFRRTIGIGYAP